MKVQTVIPKHTCVCVCVCVFNHLEDLHLKSTIFFLWEGNEQKCCFLFDYSPALRSCAITFFFFFKLLKVSISHQTWSKDLKLMSHCRTQSQIEDLIHDIHIFF